MTAAKLVLPAVLLVAVSMASAQEKLKAMMRVRLPAPRTKLEIQGAPIKVTDQEVRLFESPPLEPGKPYVYDVKATWMENGQELTRERSVKVLAGQTTEVDLRLEVDPAPGAGPKPGAGDKPADPPAQPADKSYVAPAPAVVEAMLQLAKVGAKDTVVDLGSGDGRIAIAAAEAHQARKAVGFESNSARLAAARRNAAALGKRVEFHARDFTTVTPEDLAFTTVVTIGTATTDQLRKLAPVLKKLKPGARVVVHEVEIPDWKFDEKRELKVNQLDHLIYLYVIK